MTTVKCQYRHNLYTQLPDHRVSPAWYASTELRPMCLFSKPVVVVMLTFYSSVNLEIWEENLSRRMFQNSKGGAGWQQYLVGPCVVWWYGCKTGQVMTAWVGPTGGQERGWAGETIRLLYYFIQFNSHASWGSLKLRNVMEVTGNFCGCRNHPAIIC